MKLRNPAAGTIRASLRHPAFRWLLGGLAVSQIGDWLYNLALVTLVYQGTHSAAWAGITTAARVVPLVALGPLGGVIADRFDRRRLMVACDVIRLVLMLVLALFAVAYLPVLLAPVIAAAATAAGTPYLPCASASTPRLVPDADLPGANAARSAVTSLGIIIGPALGGVLLLVGSPAVAFLVNAGSFGLSALAVLAIPAGPAFQPGEPEEQPTGLLRGVVQGAAVLRAYPQALRLVGADIICSLVYGMQTVLLLLVAHQAGLGLHGYGYLFAGIGAGALAGTTLAGRALRFPRPRAVLAAALGAVGLPMLGLAVTRWAAAALVLVAITGVGAILVEVLTETSLQRTLPAEMFGRAYGLALPAAIGGIAVGSLIAPLLINAFGETGTLVACGTAVIAYSLVVLPAPRAGRRAAAIPALVATVAAALALAVLVGRGYKTIRLTEDQAASSSQPVAAIALGTYPGQQHRGVFQAITRIVATGRTIVTTGWLTSDNIVRQQFFVSPDGGQSWHLASVRAPDRGPVPLGHAATRLAGGPRGWLAVGPQAIWTSPDGQSWTLAASHGIAPQLTGDAMWVLSGTAQGFLAAGVGTAGGGATQAVIWTSHDGVTWRRSTAAQLGLAGPGETVQSISYATSQGPDTVISGTVAQGGMTYSGAWLSADGGSTWSRVMVPADHGAGISITGLGFDGSGLIAVRPGRSATGAGDGVIYFSPNGRTWRYAATISAAGGWSPDLVKGSDYGFVVAGTSATGQIVAYWGPGTATTWRATAPLGNAARESVASVTVGTGDTVLAVGSTAASPGGQQPVFLQATASAVRPVPLARIPGAVIGQVAVNALASADGQQIAAGSADGYPAIWRQAGRNSWSLVSSLTMVLGEPGLTALTGVTHGPAGWLAVGMPGPVVYTSVNGTAWRPAPGSIARDLAGVTSVAATAGPHGYVIVGQVVAPGGAGAADVWFSPSLTSWTRAHDVNDAGGSSQVVAVAADAHGFVSVGSHDGQPAVWTTSNGTAWTTIVVPLASGTTGVLQHIAINGDHVAALGERTVAGVSTPLALSADGAASWRQTALNPPGPDAAITALTADAGGFTAAVESGPPGRQHVTVWTSAGGASWTQARVGGLSGAGTGLTALASTGASVTGIGSIATPYRQQPVTWTFPAR